jgi:predicted PurR-regulated permease PerM
VLGLNGAEIVYNPSATVAGLSQYLWKLEQPAHAAANGYLDTIITKLGYEYNGNIKDELFYDNYKKILYHTQNFIYIYFFHILFFIFLFLFLFLFYHKQMIRYLPKIVKQNIRIK